MKRNETGFSLVEITFVLFIVSLISIGGWLVWQSKTRADHARESADKASSTTGSGTIKSFSQSQQSLSPSPIPTPTSIPTPITPTPSPSRSPKPSPVPTPVPAPSPIPVSLTPSITISSDGCTVTANGTQGDILHISVFNMSKGGDSDFTLPLSGTLSQLSGGIQGMTVDATLRTSVGSLLVERTSTIIADHCW